MARRVRVMTSVMAVVAVAAFGGLGTNGAAHAAARPTLTDLRGVDELKTLFNQDAGKVRLVLLVSPT